ncbi:unnamed protein product [Agarophyton chilense]
MRQGAFRVPTAPRVPAALLLASGHVFPGYSFGYERCVAGEAVFQTGMVGYPEALTDPSYAAQILVLTYPIVGNYGVPDMSAVDQNFIPLHAESKCIHAAALVVAEYSTNYSHWNATTSLSNWLIEQRVPAITGVDTRQLTKIIRRSGTLLARLVVNPMSSPLPPLSDPNARNLVAEVTVSEELYITGAGPVDAPRILVLDCGVKNNQLRALRKRARSLLVVPWNATLPDFTAEYDAMFITNGPGDPAMLSVTVENIRQCIQDHPNRPIFGICLGHQLLARAAGFDTYKLKYGNRGHNQPCIDLSTGRCHITSQNHGFAVDDDPDKWPAGWFSTFLNANDGTNEGIAHKTLPFFSVQFHPEACAGPQDTEYLFDLFVNSAVEAKAAGKTKPLFDFSAAIKRIRERKLNESPHRFPLSSTIKKVIVLGSGGLSIGQAGEFDYSGSQAIKALKSQSVRTVLINPNIATVQTSPGLADKVYYLPVTPDNVLKVAENERPDGILMTFGGQTALNCGVKLYNSGALEKLGIKVLGTPVEAILDTEDRHRFNSRLEEIGEPFADSRACKTIEHCLKAAEEVGYPVILRAAFALGGLGSGFADDAEQLAKLASRAFASSSQVLVERSMKGWKEIEYEVVRDAYDNCITVCNMENFDPLGIHTGDSIVVAPSQTLSDAEYHMLRNAAIRTVRHLGVIGECNIQYALNPQSMQYCIIEVNARLSRSSALASKATGYPLAFVAAQLALGIPLPEIRNSITKETSACFEPSLDYIVVKIPRWDLKKFTRVSRSLGSSMKSVGEVMAIGRTFEETLQKAVRMARDNYVFGFESGVVEYSEDLLKNPTDDRLLAIADGLAKGVSVERIHELTDIDNWFLCKLARISAFEAQLRNLGSIDDDMLINAKQLGFSDRQVAKLLDATELAIRKQRLSSDIRPCVKQIDTVAAEFPAKTNYLYVTYSCMSALRSGQALPSSYYEDSRRPNTSLSTSPATSPGLIQSVADCFRLQDDVSFNEHGIIVLGCGAYRIGSSVEFDCCAVSAIRTLRSQRARSVMINYNPETVSTDYDECDRLYFEELSFERVLDIYDVERSSGIIVSMGGQIANNIAMRLHRQSARILGTTPEMIDNAENRYKFSRMCDKNGVDQPRWKELSSLADAKAFGADVGYPVLVRPSYVLSGAAMNVAHKAEDLEAYLTEAATVSNDSPVVISKFILEAKEIEVDAVANKGELVMHVISEHIENAGVHSGDATLVLPPQDLAEITVRKVEEATAKVARALNVTGPMNIQFIAKNNSIKVIECNLRASRTFPFISKTIGLDLAKLATKVMLGKPVLPYPVDVSKIPFVGVKVAQFSFTRLLGADPILGVEMASTGEVACFGASREEAYMKGLIATSRHLPSKSVAVSIGTYKEKLEFLASAKRLKELGYNLIATPGTADFFQGHGVEANVAVWSNKNEYSESEVENTIERMLRDGRIEFFINIPSNNNYRRLASFESPGYKSRRAAVDFSIPLLTNIKCAKLFVKVLSFVKSSGKELPLIEVDIDETWEGPAASDVSGVPCRGYVRRVVNNGAIAFLDGRVWAERGSGDIACLESQPLKKSPSVRGLPVSPFKPNSRTALDPSRTDEQLPFSSLTLSTGTHASRVGDLQRSTKSTQSNASLAKKTQGLWNGSAGVTDCSPFARVPEELDVVVEDVELSNSHDSLMANGSDVRKTEVIVGFEYRGLKEALPGYGSGWWAGRHVLSVSQFTRNELYKLFEVAHEMRIMVSRVGHYELLRGKVMASLFYEPSTRTSCSFQAAMQRLGGTVLSIQDIGSSSVAKGESLGDTIRTLGCYSDIIVLRHPAVGAAQQAAYHSRLPIINAGDGIGEHPTQALLDVFTIREELGTVNNVTITFVGDLKNGRTVHSLARVLALYSVRFRYVSPECLRMPHDLLEELSERGVPQYEHVDLSDDVIKDTDVLYVTRVQKERFESQDHYEHVKDAYMITPKTLTKAKEQMIIMHPLPRVGEISTDVDTDPRAVYFRQMEHGMYVRMALLAMVLGKN